MADNQENLTPLELGWLHRRAILKALGHAGTIADREQRTLEFATAEAVEAREATADPGVREANDEVTRDCNTNRLKLKEVKEGIKVMADLLGKDPEHLSAPGLFFKGKRMGKLVLETTVVRGDAQAKGHPAAQPLTSLEIFAASLYKGTHTFKAPEPVRTQTKLAVDGETEPQTAQPAPAPETAPEPELVAPEPVAESPVEVSAEPVAEPEEPTEPVATTYPRLVMPPREDWEGLMSEEDPNRSDRYPHLVRNAAQETPPEVADESPAEPKDREEPEEDGDDERWREDTRPLPELQVVEGAVVPEATPASQEHQEDTTQTLSFFNWPNQP